ncbi:MAG: GldG family protein [Brevundimonas sp.]|nr:GldG family protein [Brevundimonas sp.]
MRLLFAPALAALLLIAGPAAGQQVVDPEFQPRVERPAYAAGGPVVVIDGAHRNFHTVDGQYAPFAALLRADGYRVRAGTLAFDAGGLDDVDVMVIANAGATQQQPTPPAFTEAEGAALEAWVREGGKLLLIADHTPFGAAAEGLAARFGVRMGTGYAFALTDGGDLTTNLTYPAEAFGDHPIFAGRDGSERVDSVTAFTGQSLDGPEGATVLLHMTDGGRESPDLPTLQALSERLDDAGAPDAVVAELSKPALPAQGLAFNHGAGRVVVLGEAGMLSAQRVRFPDGREVRFGMNVAPGNARFGLNILHWLTGLLP